ncbi:unnamed protein product [Schistosoma intercalatum]|nr:unnamed protein product [Schistosoma intercalatum]CAH8551906.1 unnamed protein product [Schistosoma intercalatum]
MSNSAFGPVLSSGTAPNLGSVPSAKEEHALGLKAIYAACRLLYPDQPTPLQVTAVRKFWMGGPDPLDFINMYANPGSAELQSPPHWHYVTNGLSDLYGDSRLHGHCHSTDGPSGFGFELTFRVKREAGETNPPTWPAHLLQSLARYVFYSQAQLMAGDHIPWPTSLDKQPNFSSQQSEKRRRHHHHHQQQQTDKETNVKELENARKSIAMAAAATAASILAANSAKTGMGSSSAALSALTNPSTYASMVAAALAAVNNNNSNDPVGQNETKDKLTTNSTNSSRIHHMLLVEDPQLKKITTPYGYVQFLQLVGLCDEELRLVQRWTGSHVAELMSCSLETGGGLLVTDMRRNLNIFEMQPNLVDYINDKLKREGSNLSGVTISYFAWAPITMVTLGELLPGEVESRRLRRQTQKRDSSSTSCLYSKSEVQSGSKAVLFHNPSTDYNTHKSDTDIGSKTVAMDTDDTLVSFAVKKRIEDDEFIDVVGGGGNGGGDETFQKLTAESYINSSTSALASVSAEPNSLKISRFEPKSRVSLSSRLSSGHLTSDCFPHSLGNRNVIDGQTISAPGGFSAWCNRVGPINQFNQSPMSRQSINKVGANTSSTGGGIFKSTLVNSPTELTNVVGGALGFRTFNSELPISNMITDKFIDTSIEPKGGNLTPGGGGSSSTTGDGSAPCTPLAHLSLSPASLDMMPTRIIDYLDVHLCREAGEMLPLAVNDRLRHGRHFTFLNANYPDHAITLVPSGVSGAFVAEETPYVARGPWLQILLTDDFLEQLEFQFSCLLYPNELHLPLVFRWPERHLRICLVDVSSSSSLSSSPPPSSNGGLPSIPLPHSQTASVTNPVSLINDTNNNIGNNSVDNSNTSDTSNISKLMGTPTTSSIHCNWNTSMVDNRLISGNNSGSVGSTLQSSVIPSAFAKSDLLPSFLSLFPPGCIPPPNVLSSLFSAMATNNSSSTSDNINTTNNDQSQTELFRKSFLPINQTVTPVPIFQTSSSSPTSLIQPSASTLPNSSHIHHHQITHQQQVRQEHQPSTTSLPTELKVDSLIDPNVFANNWSMFLQTLMRNSNINTNNTDSLRQIISGSQNNSVATTNISSTNPTAYFMEFLQNFPFNNSNNNCMNMLSALTSSTAPTASVSSSSSSMKHF